MAATCGSLLWLNWSQLESKLIPALMHIQITCDNDVINVLDTHTHTHAVYRFLTVCVLSRLMQTTWLWLAGVWHCNWALQRSSDQAHVFLWTLWRDFSLVETEERHTVNGKTQAVTMATVRTTMSAGHLLCSDTDTDLWHRTATLRTSASRT